MASSADHVVVHPIAQRAARGAIALLIRQAFVYGSNIVAGILLARLLTPSEFGFYGVVIFAVLFLNVFGGTGFAANLIRLPESPSLNEKRAVFAAQECMIATLFVAIWFSAPYFAMKYHVPGQGETFLRLIGISLVFTSLMVIPQIQLERDLAFDRLALIEVFQAIVFNGCTVALAWRGKGILSFAIALALRSTSGAILANIMSPWRIGFEWNFRIIREHAQYGIALQAGSLLSTLKDSIAPVFIGAYLGAAFVGYVTWANALATYSVAALIPLQRLYLPFFAKFQHDRQELTRYVFAALWIANAISAPLTVITVALAHPITVEVFGGKWLYALPLFYYMVVGNVFTPGGAPMLGLLNALGRSKTTFVLILMWAVSTWILAVPLTMRWHLAGYGVAMIGVNLTSLILFRIVWKELGASPFKSYWPSWPLSVILGVVLYFIQRHWTPSDIKELAVFALAAIVIYIVILWFIYPERIRMIQQMLRTDRQVS